MFVLYFDFSRQQKLFKQEVVRRWPTAVNKRG